MLNERELSKTELEKREDAMMDLKANKRSFVKRYGKDAEKVMYGRATNIAKKQAENMNKEKLRELIKDKLKGPVKEIDVEVGADRYEEEEKLATAAHALDQLEAALKAHDWFYMMADDNRAYTAGRAKEAEIRSIIDDLEKLGYGKDAKDLYNSMEPYSKAFGGTTHKLAEKKGKDMDKDGDIDSDDYMAAKDAAIKKAKGEIKEDWGGSDQYAMNQSIHRDLGNPTEFPGLGKVMDAAESAVDFYWDEWPEYKTDRDGLIMHAAQLYANRMFPEFMDGMRKMFAPMNEGNLGHNEIWSLEPEGPYWILTYTTIDGKKEKVFKSEEEAKTWIEGNLNEDLDLGHQDNEPHMIKAELYRIGKYAMELYAMVEEFGEMGGEVDFPAWWQAKITTAANNMISAKHYLDFEIKEPAIDAAVDALTDEKPHMGEPEMGAPEMEDEIPIHEETPGKVDMLAAKIAKALKAKSNQSSEDQENIKQARKAMNDGNTKAAEKIIAPYIAEKLAKQLKSK